MTLGYFEYYLIGANILGFILFAINTWLYTHTAEKQIDKLLTVTSLLGGSLGIVIAILIIDRKAEKGNMMSRVFVICVLIIQIIILLIAKGYHGDKLNLAFWSFFSEHKILIVYLIVINVIAIKSTQ